MATHTGQGQAGRQTTRVPSGERAPDAQAVLQQPSACRQSVEQPFETTLQSHKRQRPASNLGVTGDDGSRCGNDMGLPATLQEACFPFHPPPKSPRGWPVSAKRSKKESAWPTAGRRWTGNQGRWAARKKRWIPRGVCKCHSQPPPPSASISPNFFASTTASLCRQAGSPAGGFRIPRASAIPEATALGQPRVNGRCVDTWYRAEPYGIQTAELFVGERVLDLGGAGSSSQPRQLMMPVGGGSGVLWEVHPSYEAH